VERHAYERREDEAKQFCRPFTWSAEQLKEIEPLNEKNGVADPSM
jgi:hypothetical protein